jgi:hypothetical protein
VEGKVKMVKEKEGWELGRREMEKKLSRRKGWEGMIGEKHKVIAN